MARERGRLGGLRRRGGDRRGRAGPLSQVPENALKFAVGVMLSAFGLFWTGESLGVDWPGGDAAIIGFAAMFLGVAVTLIALLKRNRTEPA